jgi:ABC-2 type transport system permease protein
MYKEIKIFWRDQTRWPQLFLVLALIILYVYNFSVLPLGDVPLRTSYLANIISYLNIGLAALVLAALVARFVYPAVAAEGRAFWIIQGAPITLGRFLRAKFWFYSVIFTALAQILIVLTNIILEVGLLVMLLSSMTMFLLAPAIVSLGLGLGAADPDFAAENHQQAATSMGGLFFMILAVTLVVAVITLTAGFAYRVFIAELSGRSLAPAEWFWISLPLLPAFFLCLAAIRLPLIYGERRLARRREIN